MSRVKSNDNVKYNTALYVRLSREDGDEKSESNSITNQKSLLQNYIDLYKEEFELYNIYSDDNYSGTNFNRPSFQAMISDIENGIVNCVIVKDLSRFGRDYIETGRYLERVFPEYNVRFIALNDGIDSFKQAYNMLLPISNIFNQQYAVDISNKTQSSFKTKRKSGEFIGAFTSYGYQKDPINHNKLVIDEYASQIVKRVFKMYVSGMGQIRIAKILNDEKILCPSSYKKQSGLNYSNSNKIESTTYWTYSTIHKMLKNEMYLGNMVQGKTFRTMKGKPKLKPEDEWIIVKDTHVPIIEKDVYEKVQNLIGRNTRQLDFKTNVSIFAGFLKCADCHRAFAKNKRGNTIYYICGSYKKYGINICTSHTITHEFLDKIILLYINFVIEQINNLKKIADSQKKLKNKGSNNKRETEKIQMSLNKVSTLKKGIYEDYKEGILSKKDYLQYKTDYEISEKLYQDKIEMIKFQDEEDENDIFKNEWMIKLLNTKRIKVLDREIIADFIKNIEIDKNKKIKIIWDTTAEINDLLNNILLSADI